MLETGNFRNWGQGGGRDGGYQGNYQENFQGIRIMSYLSYSP